MYSQQHTSRLKPCPFKAEDERTFPQAVQPCPSKHQTQKLIFSGPVQAQSSSTQGSALNEGETSKPSLSCRAPRFATRLPISRFFSYGVFPFPGWPALSPILCAWQDQLWEKRDLRLLVPH